MRKIDIYTLNMQARQNHCNF